MATLLEGNALFLHIPKTGGSWVRHVLREQGLVKMEWPHPHPDLHRILNIPRYYPLHFIKQSLKLKTLRLYREVQNSYKFCFVRHPHDWYESYWRFMKGVDWKHYHEERQDERRHVMKKAWHPNAALESMGPSSFEGFIRNVLRQYPGYLTQMYGWYAAPDEVDFVGRTESLAEDLLSVLRKVGAEVDEEAVRETDRVNTSPAWVERPEWDAKLYSAVRRLEAPVFQRFGYE